MPSTSTWFFAALLVPVVASADVNRFGVAAGLMVPLELRVGDERPKTEPGPLISFTFDRIIDPLLDVGVFIHGGGFAAGERDELVNLFEFGVAGHYRLDFGEVSTLRLGGGIGYRRLFSDVTSYDRVHGLGIDADVEYSHILVPGVIGQVRFGVLSQPLGSNGDSSVAWVPIPYLTIGVVVESR